MRFPERELKPYSEPVSSEDLKEGLIYFSLTFVDDDMLIPTMEPFVFIGRNLEPGNLDRVYFQDVDSYRQGVPYTVDARKEHATFLEGSETELGHFFHFDNALDVLLACALRRKSTLP